MRRPVSLLLAIACCVPVLPAAVDSVLDTAQALPVSMAELTTKPDTYREMVVRFPAIFCEVGKLYDRNRTHYNMARYLNLVLWDGRARLWEPSERGNALATAYISKARPGADLVNQLSKYQPVMVECRVDSTMDGKPWIEILSIQPIRDAGRWSDPAIANLGLAVGFAAEGTRDLAEEHFASALAENLPVTARAQTGELRARSLMAASRWAAAATVLRNAIAAADLDPLYPANQRAGLHALLARCLSEDGANQYEAAASEARTAIAIDPTLSESYAVLGISLAGLGKFDEARVQCDRAVRMRPNDATVRLYLGRILDQQGRPDEAIEALKHAIDLTPKDGRIHRAIALAYLNRAKTGRNEDLPTAFKECDITLRLNATDADAHVLAGQVIEAAVKTKTELTIGGTRAVPTLEQAKDRYRAALGLVADHAAAKAALLAIEPQLAPAPAAAPVIEAPAPAPAPQVEAPAPAPVVDTPAQPAPAAEPTAVTQPAVPVEPPPTEPTVAAEPAPAPAEPAPAPAEPAPAPAEPAPAPAEPAPDVAEPVPAPAEPVPAEPAVPAPQP